MNRARFIAAMLMCTLAQVKFLMPVPRTRVASIPIENPYSLDEPSKIKLFGLARLDTLWDSRQNLGFISSAYTLSPAPTYPDHNGCDINACSEFIVTPANSLLGADVGTFKIGRALLTGRFIGLFSGISLGTAGLFAIGQTYAQIDWRNTRLVVGNDRHPFMSKITHPYVLAISSGAPFAPYADAPQIRLTYKFKNFSISPTILGQFEYPSDGPVGLEPIYLYNSGLPVFNCMLEYETDRVAWGIGIDVKRLRPALASLSLNPYPITTYVNPAMVTSFITSAYLNLQFSRAAILSQICGGQNGADLLLPGGYGVSNRNTKTNRKCYTNTYFLSLWGEIDINTNNNFKPGFFVGYAKTFGTRRTTLYLNPKAHKKDRCAQPTVYGLDRFTGFDATRGAVDDNLISGMDNCERASAYVRYLFATLELGLEVEVSRAVFGPFDAHAKVVKACPQTNLHLLGVASYYF